MNDKIYPMSINYQSVAINDLLSEYSWELDKGYYNFSLVVSHLGAQWMAQPQAVTGAPPGLGYLAALDQIIIKQRVELLEGTC